jgi:hypothetical protein
MAALVLQVAVQADGRLISPTVVSISFGISALIIAIGVPSYPSLPSDVAAGIARGLEEMILTRGARK